MIFFSMKLNILCLGGFFFLSAHKMFVEGKKGSIVVGSRGKHKIKIISGVHNVNAAIEQELTKFVYKGSDDKYFRLCS